MALCGCLFAACSSDDDDDVNKQHDGTLYGEWLGTSGYYYKDYYYFSSDGTGEHGSYDVSIDESSVDEDFNGTRSTASISTSTELSTSIPVTVHR